MFRLRLPLLQRLYTNRACEPHLRGEPAAAASDTQLQARVKCSAFRVRPPWPWVESGARAHSRLRHPHSQSRTLGIAAPSPPSPPPRKQEGLTFSARHKTLFFVVASINKGMTGDIKYNHAGEESYLFLLLASVQLVTGWWPPSINKRMTGDIKYNHAGACGCVTPWHGLAVPSLAFGFAHRWCGVLTVVLVRSGPHALCVFLYCMLLLCPLLPKKPTSHVFHLNAPAPRLL